jgi:imidazole glycerol-phosphate synthase subunit HisH
LKIGVVDYEAGNLKSVVTALRQVNLDFFVSDNPKELLRADKLIFPGVGEARAAMDVLTAKGIGDAILEFTGSGKPFLGICIGYQILFDMSEERDTPCLGIIPGKVRRFPRKAGFKVPHMGWNEVETRKGDNPLFRNIPPKSSFYFVHSYYPEPAADEDIAGDTDYIISFAACYQRENVTAVQFHPEKSGEVGLQFLTNFAAGGK